MDGTVFKLIEVFLVFGGVLAFAAWQLWDVRRSREQAKLEEERRLAATGSASPPGDATAPSASPPDPKA